MIFIQLTFLFLLALINLSCNILINIIDLDYSFKFITQYLIKFKFLINLIIKNFKFTLNNSFFIYYIIIEILIRNINIFSPIVRYNALLLLIIFALENLLKMYWNFLFNYDYLKSNLNHHNLINLNLLTLFYYIITYIIHFILYIYLYIFAIFNKYPKILGLNWLTNSILILSKLKSINKLN